MVQTTCVPIVGETISVQWSVHALVVADRELRFVRELFLRAAGRYSAPSSSVCGYCSVSATM